MTRKLKMLLNEEGGAVQIVEASFVFPVMFIILFFLIYMGNAFYFKAEVEAIATEKAIEGAAYCADPLLEYMKDNNNSLPPLSDLDSKPYRYIFGGMGEIESKISDEVKDAFKSKTISLMRNMKPKISSGGKIASFNNYFVYSTFSVDVNYKIKFPIRFLGSSSPTILSVTTHSEVAVNDAAEFIRNTDMAVDYFADTKLGQTVSSAFQKIREFIDSFAEK